MAVQVQQFPAPDGARDIVVEDGERLRVVGPNGSGKSSLLRAIAGLEAPLRPEQVRLDGDAPDALPADELSRRVALVHQDARDTLIGLTVASEYRFRGLEAADDEQEVATLSSGETRRVALDVAQAPLLLLDEPVEGLDAAGLSRLRRRIEEHAGTVVFVDHDGRLADLATRTVALGTPPDPPLPQIPAASGQRWRRPATNERDIALPAIDLEPGFHVLTGPNGCGKTTALRAWADAGGDPEVAWMGPRARDLMASDRVDGLITPAGPLAALADRHPLALSGGEMQRVALTMTFARDRRVLLLDEPEAHLDGEGRAWLVACIAQAVEAGRIVVAATHDPALIALATSTIAMEGR